MELFDVLSKDLGFRFILLKGQRGNFDYQGGQGREGHNFIIKGIKEGSYHFHYKISRGRMGHFRVISLLEPFFHEKI